MTETIKVCPSCGQRTGFNNVVCPFCNAPFPAGVNAINIPDSRTGKPIIDTEMIELHRQYKAAMRGMLTCSIGGVLAFIVTQNLLCLLLCLGGAIYEYQRDKIRLRVVAKGHSIHTLTTLKE